MESTDIELTMNGNKINDQIIGRPLIQDWCFQDRILNATFDCVLMLLHTTVLQIPKARKKNASRRCFDYCGIITTKYK
jgi:hypothetical protein